MLTATSDFTELVFFFLAHVPRRGVDSLFGPELVRASGEWLSAEARARLAETTPLLADASGQDLQWWPELFSSLDQFLRATDRALCELQPDDVAAPGVLARLRGDGRQGELVHAELSLLAGEFAGRYASHIEPDLHAQLLPVETALAPALDRRPELGSARIELSACLGSHGRVFPRRIVVGAPAPWNELTPGTSACWAIHEWLVRQAKAEYAQAEWSALVGGGRLVEGTPLADARRAWLRHLSLAPLLERLGRERTIELAVVETLTSDPGSLQDPELFEALEATSA